MRVKQKTIISIMFFLIAGFLYAAYLFSDILFHNEREQKLKGLEGEVIIYRDRYGIPHINALKSDNDAFFALGYVHAEDRLWQMELQRRIVQGRLSEIFSSLTLSEDKFIRTMGFYRAAQDAIGYFEYDIYDKIHSYIQGINAYIKRHGLPWQFKLLHVNPELWTEVDAIAWQKMMAWNLQFGWFEKIRNQEIVNLYGSHALDILIPPYPLNSPVVISELQLVDMSHPMQKSSKVNGKNPDFLHLKNDMNILSKKLAFEITDGKGSNAWVVSGKYTESGKPLLASDPHLGVSAPLLWYLAELKGPHFHVVGATIAGVPAVVIGHNDFISWGLTNADPDVEDLYIEPSDVKLNQQHEIIKVRGRKDYDLTVSRSQHGPIINSVDFMQANKVGTPVAFRWTALDKDDTTVQSIIEINYAKNWEEFKQALRSFVVPSLTFIYADRQGNIGAYLPGKIPIRNGFSGEFPLGVQHEWNGYIPFDELPHTYNPSTGYIVSANNKIVTDRYSYTITPRWLVPPYRAGRIETLIKKAKPLSIDTMKTIQLDVTSQIWLEMKELLLKTAARDELSAKGLALLQSWDGKMQIHSIPTTIFSYWYNELNKLYPANLQTDTLWSHPLFIINQLKNNGSYCLNSNTNCTDFLSMSLQDAMHKLVHDLSSDKGRWQWGNLHQLVFSDPVLSHIKPLAWLINRTSASHGGIDTINVGTYRKDNFNIVDAPGYRQIVDLGHLDRSLFIQALGQSGNLISKHYADLLPLWREGVYLPMQMDSTKDSSMTRLLPDEEM